MSSPTENQIEGNSTILDRQETTCCIVGGGPAGAVLSLLLARKGVKVTLLETHRDFDRDFRGDTLHPSVMEIMDELGLAEKLLELPHTKLRQGVFQTNTQALFGVDFNRLKTKFPYITLMPQSRFLEFITQEAAKYPTFQLILGANAQELIEENGAIQGVRYKGQGGLHEVRALLTIAADGRNSKLRQLADLHPVSTSTPMDVLWFRLPRHPDEPTGVMGRIGKGHMMAMLDRTEMWQIAYLIPKGGYQELRSAGLEALCQSVVETVPELSDRVQLLHEWSQIAFLAVESSCLKQWYRPGLLLIGDAAHVMSPVGGVGINYAIQDAVVAGNILTEPLKQGKVELHHLAKIQRQRWLPTRIIQAFQGLVQSRIISQALNPDTPFTPPALLQLPILKDLPARIIGLGIWRVHVET
ncbi:FAD-dependent oxidoreductase [Merismopedia glauca]|uniref:Monooxygenase n=1 Tax=Merismopedia glauca CCAP 1448/3 TaxID=1296344 RepID=A0A2T1C689_9CYAN|nr:FAD-dependent oxidoreductase [Merismopedia glauca]PSB03795.1 monooxygenase [Merismopedia glauca CCAP 1448/3]